MAPSFSDTWRTFWHAVTTNDRHATYNSPYKTGQHVPLPQSNHAPLTAVATSAIDSRVDLGRQSPQPESAGANGFKSPKSSTSPASPYSPGMRSAQRRVPSMERSRSSTDKSPVPDIPMQNFSDGLPPPPPVDHSWKRIERWLEDNYQELFDNVCEPATLNDVNELELELDCSLPIELRDSLQVHDGQERGGLPTGLVFGCMILDCEEIVEEWRNWRAVNEQYLINQQDQTVLPIKPVNATGSSAASSSAPTSAVAASPSQTNGAWKEKLLGKQDSQPPNAVQKAYAHSSWIPLVKDWGGNCLAVDLAPGPAGKWGQIILFGRDYDCKYVVSRSWGAFLASLADDLTSDDKVFVDEENGDLKFKPFKKQGVEPPYFEVLRWRCDQRYGRRPQARSRQSNGLRINSNVPTSPFDHHNSATSASPYASPTSAGADMRGRSPQRSNGKAPLVPSPMRTMVSSPLARVAEEAPAPLTVRTDTEGLKGFTGNPVDRLVSVDTPRASGDFPATRIGTTSSVTSGSATPTMSISQEPPRSHPVSEITNKNDENKAPISLSSNTITDPKAVSAEPPASSTKDSTNSSKTVTNEQSTLIEEAVNPITSPTSTALPAASGKVAEDSNIGELKTVEI